MINNKNIYRIAYVLSLIILSNLFSFYYHNDFSSTLPTEWVTNYEYAMEGYLVSGGNASVITSGGGTLVVDGDPYNICCEYNGTWSGNTVLLTNQYYATAEQPFGFDIYRTESQIDGDTTQGVNSATRSENQLDIWLVDSSTISSNSYISFENYFLFFERGTRGNANLPYDFFSNPINISRTGIFSQSLIFLDLSSSLDKLGNNVDISKTNTNYHSLNFKYNWEGDADAAGGTGDFSNANIPNTNDYIFRIIHNGEYISLYINPDPDDNDDYPNEFLFITNKRVYWSSNLSIMIGHEVKNDHMVLQRAVYNDLLIRSSAEGSGFYMGEPQWDDSDMAFNVDITISNIVTDLNSGVNTITVKYKDNLSFNGLIDNTILINGVDSDFIYKIFDDRLVIIFPKLNKDNPVYKFTLSMRVKTPKKNKTKYELDFFVEGVQYQNYKSSWGKAATCGMQKSLGDGTIYKKINSEAVTCK